MDFIIRKDIYGNWWHDYNNNATKVNISDFEAIIDDVANTFVIQCFNGSNVPTKAIGIENVKVIDQNVSETPIPFSGAVGLKNLLTSKQYPPYRNSSIVYDEKIVWKKGHAVVWNETQEFFDENFDENGLGIGLAVGWGLCNGNGGRKDFRDRTIVSKGTNFATLYQTGGSANAVLIGHNHDSIEFSDGEKSVNTLGLGASILGKIASFTSGTQKINKTSTKGIANNGAEVPSEDGVGKNMPPYIIAQWVERTEDLIVYYTGSEGGTTPSLAQVLNVQDRVFKELTDTEYTFAVDDRVKFIGWAKGNNITLNLDDSGSIFPDYSTIIISVGDDSTINAIGDTDLRLDSDNGNTLSTYNLLAGDFVILKKAEVLTWILTVLRRGGSVVPSSLISADAGNQIIEGSDEKLYVAEFNPPTPDLGDYISTDANNQLELGTDEKLFVPPVEIPIDETPTDGSSNAVSSNGVFDALALKQNNLKTFNTTQGIYYFEEFLGQSRHVDFGIGNAQGSSAYTASITNRTNQQGVVQHTTNANSTGQAGFTFVNGAFQFIGGGVITLEEYVNITTLSTLAERFFTFFGYVVGSSFTNILNNIAIVYDEGGVYLNANASPNFKCITRAGTTATTTVTSIPVVAGQWYKLRIVINATASSVEFYIDNVLVATHNTNIPLTTTAMYVANGIAKATGTAARSMQTDYFMYEQIFTNPR